MPSPLEPTQAYQHRGNSVEWTSESGERCRIDVVTRHIVRVRQTRDAHFPTGTLNRYGLIDEPQEPGLHADVHHRESAAHNGQLSIGTGAMKIVADPSASRLDFEDNDGDTLLRGDPQGTLQLHQDGYQVNFSITANEAFYGFGDQNRERLEHRGTKPRMWIVNAKRYIPIPFFMSSRGYGILVNTTRDVVFDLGSTEPNRLSFQSPGGSIDFYMIHGPGLPDILDRYTQLTGRPALPPKWSFGLWFICRTQANDHEVMTDAHTFRREGIPCDIISLEPGWMEKNYDPSPNKDWHPERFPYPRYAHLSPYTFTSALKRLGFKIGLWECNDYDLSIEADRMADRVHTEAGSSHASDPPPDETPGIPYLEPDEHLRTPRFLDRLTKVNEPWFEHHKRFVDQGVDLFKQDGAYQVLDHPDRRWANGMGDDEMHNLYPLLYSQQMYEGFKEHTERRPCCFTPAGWAGLQRYTGTWTGDTGGKADTLVACLNLALSGHSLVTCDMEVTSKEGIHYGFLMPWAQVNSWNYWRHPWLLGDELGLVFKEYAHLRYRLLPYIYSCAHVAHQTGMPMMRPMPLAFPEEKEAHGYKFQYLFGPSLLVSAFTHEIYLPRGLWFDYWTGVPYEGARRIEYTPPDDKGGALFVRSGAVIPTAPVQQYVGAERGDALTVEVFPQSSGELVLYDDDGVSFKYEQGRVSQTKYTLKDAPDHIQMTIHERQGTYQGAPASIDTRLKVRTPHKPQGVFHNDEKLVESGFTFSSEEWRTAGRGWSYDGAYTWISLGPVGPEGGVCRLDM